MNFYPLVRPLLFTLPPETAHHFSLATLKLLDKCLRTKQITPDSVNATEVMGLSFPNRLGLAAGLDKSGAYIDALSRLGFGFLEIGTITPRGQTGNKKPRLFRLKQSQALINRMGFNNPGISAAITHIQNARYQGILGINIGKNFDTPLEHALEDYVTGFHAFYPHASYITVNISSPNTPGLRELQNPEALTTLLDNLKIAQGHCQNQHQRHVPLVVKVAPDLSAEQIQQIGEILLRYEVDGLIATNTTNQRPESVSDADKAEQGGLSGAPIHTLSVAVIKQFYRVLQDKIPIIGVGGISSPEDYQATLAAGAKLCQLYTGLIYQGPQLVSACLRSERL